MRHLKEDAFTDRVKGVLRELYCNNSPYTSGELADMLDEKAAVVGHGNPGLGGFAVKLVEQLKQDFPAELETTLSQLDGKTNKWYSLAICDFIRHKEEGKNVFFYFCLKSRFRAALALCFGNEISNW